MRSSDPHTEPVIVGRVGGAYGVSGWVRITSFTDPPENIRTYRPWLLAGKSAGAASWSEIDVQAVDAHGDGYVARLEGVTNREQAQALAGTLIAVPPSCLPELDDDEFYWRDLVGCDVVDTAGRHLGRVDHLMETGAHDVLVIEGENGGCMIPFLREFVLQVDRQAHRLLVDWQEPD